MKYTKDNIEENREIELRRMYVTFSLISSIMYTGWPKKNGASVFYCKYFENSTTELRESW